MSDTFGSETLPIAEPDTGEPVGDYALHLVAQWLGAAINAHGRTAWKTVRPEGALTDSDKPVRTIFTKDPSKAQFATKDCPALFLFRDTYAEPQDIAADWHIDSSVWKLWWVVPPTTQAKFVQRRPFTNAIRKIVAHVIERHRDPSFVIDGDTDNLAEAEGSNVPVAASLHSIRVGKATNTTMVVELLSGADRVERFEYDLFEILLHVEERRLLDLDLHEEALTHEQKFEGENAVITSTAVFTAPDPEP